VLNNNKFTLVNVCFQHKQKEEIGIFWQALSMINQYFVMQRAFEF
jgi:hypothetical protein